MKVLLVGGGSGGHIMPLLAVANQLKRKHPACRISVVSERMGNFNHIFDDMDHSVVNRVYYINAGKYRRYSGQNWVDVLLDFKRTLLNIADIFKLMIGIVESFWVLLRARPNVVFIKGGYVGVPMGLACRLLHIPYVTHDSDAVPGLTNRLISKKAKANAVGMPEQYYPYAKDKIVYVGIPVTDDFMHISEETRAKKRRELDLNSSDFLLLVTGGSNGALRLDRMVHNSLERLLEKYPKLNIVHQVGKNNEELYKDYPTHLHSRIRVASFLRPLSAYISASDAVISRAGATSLVEIGLQKKPLIVIPNPYLSGGHQTKNAHVYADKKAIMIINEHQADSEPKALSAAIEQLMTKPSIAEVRIRKMYKMLKKDSAEHIADLLVKLARKEGIRS